MKKKYLSAKEVFAMNEHIRPVVSLNDLCTNDSSVPATREEVMANLTQLMLRISKTLDRIVKENN